MGRRNIADSLKEATKSYYLKKGYSCFEELGLLSWGKLRADVLCLNLKGEIILAEVKSSIPDFRSDIKWVNYLPYCNRMTFIFTSEVYARLSADELANIKSHGVGILVLDTSSDTSGYLKSVINTRYHKMKKKTKRLLIIRMAWRNGVSKRNSRRKRVYLC